MGKQGPCCHCGISSTPLWRNGPPDKPVLCNACGSRWRTKGTLVNYMPMHSGGCGLKGRLTETKAKHAKKRSQNFKGDEGHLLKRKKPCEALSYLSNEHHKIDYSSSLGLEEEVSTRSSSGSGLSYSESCAQYITLSESCSDRWPPWDCPVPSKRRSVMYRHRPSKKRHYSALFNSNSCIHKCPSEEDLLVECKPSLMTVEIGLGGVIIKPPKPTIFDQESQASSMMFVGQEDDQSIVLKCDDMRNENQCIYPTDRSMKRAILRGKEKTKQRTQNIDAGCTFSIKTEMPNKALLENFSCNKHDILRSCCSPLGFVEMKDIINMDTFMGLLTEKERHELMGHMSSVDTQMHESLKCMFKSPQFENAMRNFQHLLTLGMFDSLESGLSPKVLQHYQHLLTLSDLTKSGWMEQCSQIFSRSRQKSALDLAKVIQGKEYLKGKLKVLSAAGSSEPDMQSTSFGFVVSGKKAPVLSAPRSCPTVQVSANSSSQSLLSDAALEKSRQADEPTGKEQAGSAKSFGSEGDVRSGSCFSDSSILLPNEGRSPSSTFKFEDAPIFELLEPDILLDLPSNLSFQQAELLQQPHWSEPSTKQTEIESKKKKSATVTASNAWQNVEGLDWDGLWNSPSVGSVNGNLGDTGKIFQ